jgi:protein-disulfide isomerase
MCIISGVCIFPYPHDIILPIPEEKKQPIKTSENEDAVSFNVNKTHLFAALIPLFFLIGLGVGYFIWGPVENTSVENEILSRLENIENILQDTSPGENPAAIESAAQADGVSEDVRRYDIEIYEDDPSLGPEDAPVTIVEFSDYACPFCRRHNIEVLEKIMTTYEGQIRYVYKDLPFQNNALPAALAAMCAQEQNMFWEFHDKLFSVEMSLGTDAYLKYAQDLGLDMDAFKTCLEEERYKDRVMADLNFATKIGVNSTPTFFINGIPVVGAQSFDVFAQVIDTELEAKN